MLKNYDYQPPVAEAMQVDYETDFLTSGEGMNPKPMGVKANGNFYDEEI